MVDTPGLVERKHRLAGYDLVARVAEHAEKLLVVQLAVGQTLLLVVPRAEEGLLTASADKVLNVPGLAQCVHHALLNGASTMRDMIA